MVDLLRTNFHRKRLQFWGFWHTKPYFALERSYGLKSVRLPQVMHDVNIKYYR